MKRLFALALIGLLVACSTPDTGPKASPVPAAINGVVPDYAGEASHLLALDLIYSYRVTPDGSHQVTPQAVIELQADGTFTFPLEAPDLSHVQPHQLCQQGPELRTLLLATFVLSNDPADGIMSQPRTNVYLGSSEYGVAWMYSDRAHQHVGDCGDQYLSVDLQLGWNTLIVQFNDHWSSAFRSGAIPESAAWVRVEHPD